MKIEWAFLRNNWNSCAKTREFLASRDIEIGAEENARKVKLDGDAVWAKMSTAEQIFAAKGRKKVLQWTPSAENRDEVLGEVMGRSGNLRAPTLLIDGKFVVGFNDELYSQFFA